MSLVQVQQEEPNKKARKQLRAFFVDQQLKPSNRKQNHYSAHSMGNIPIWGIRRLVHPEQILSTTCGSCAIHSYVATIPISAY